MDKTIRKIGNSQGIILSKVILDSLGVQIGDMLCAKVKNGRIILEPRGIR